MNEKDLNIEYICEKTLLNKDDELVPIILSLIQESYKAGLCQAEYDNTMNLIEENQELKEKLYLCTPEIPQNSHNNYISYVDLINKLYSVEKEIDILLNVQEDAEKSLHKIRELKRELNKVNEENKRLKEQIEDLLTQQKEFTKFLEDELLDVRYYARNIAHYIEYVLRKYKEIVNGTEQK